MTKGGDRLLSFRKEGSPRVTFRCGVCYDRMYRQQEDANGAVLKEVRLAYFSGPALVAKSIFRKSRCASVFHDA